MVKYNDLDTAVRECLRLLQEADVLDDPELKGLIEKGERPILYLGKTDLSSTFRVLPLKVCCFCWLVFKAVDLTTGETMYFVDKCLPFGASISCTLYQKFSNAL